MTTSRRVWVSPATASPNGRWVEQQARNVLQEQGETPTYLIRNRDTKFTRHFDEIFKTEGLYTANLDYGDNCAPEPDRS